MGVLHQQGADEMGAVKAALPRAVLRRSGAVAGAVLHAEQGMGDIGGLAGLVHKAHGHLSGSGAHGQTVTLHTLRVGHGGAEGEQAQSGVLRAIGAGDAAAEQLHGVAGGQHHGAPLQRRADGAFIAAQILQRRKLSAFGAGAHVEEVRAGEVDVLVQRAGADDDLRPLPLQTAPQRRHVGVLAVQIHQIRIEMQKLDAHVQTLLKA